MSKTKETSSQLAKAYEHLLNIDDYIVSGISTGFPDLDKRVGKMRKGQLWTVGGFSGSGKSYFILNLINSISQYKKLNICIIGVEMSTTEYLMRLACMREGIYEQDLYNDPRRYEKAIMKQIDQLSQDFPEQGRIFEIHGDVNSYEQVEKILADREFDIIIIDYIQMLSVGKLYSEVDTMPVLAHKLKALAHKHNSVVVAVSQLNNSATQLNMATTQSQPFSFGKQLVNNSSACIALLRQKINGEYSKHLVIQVTKARHGIVGTTARGVGGGYRLYELPQDEKRMAIESYIGQK